MKKFLLGTLMVTLLTFATNTFAGTKTVHAANEKNKTEMKGKHSEKNDAKKQGKAGKKGKQGSCCHKGQEAKGCSKK